MKRHFSLQQQYIHKQNGAEMVEKYQKENIWYDSLTPMKFLSIISIHYLANWILHPILGVKNYKKSDVDSEDSCY